MDNRVAQPVRVIADNSTNSLGADRSKDLRKLIGDGFCHSKLHLARITRQEVYGIQISRVTSGIDADVEPRERYVQEYADRKCDFSSITTAIVLPQGAEQPADGASRSAPTLGA